MKRTNALRKLVKTKLDTLNVAGGVYYQRANEDSMFPHISFTISSIDELDLWRHDYSIEVDIWAKRPDDAAAEDIADDVEDLFNNVNAPQDEVLPTFFLDGRYDYIDEDKTILHKQVRIVVQNYEV